MIPGFNQSGVLPPFLPNSSPTVPADMSPYKATMLELAQRYGNTPERRVILTGLLDFRDAMRAAGFNNGFQWINGSFVEDCERIRNRPPDDIDVVTFSRRLGGYNSDQWRLFVRTNPQLFNPGIVKLTYKCDAYFEDLDLPAEAIVSKSRYWFGLFSHQRDTSLWKGLLEIPLVDNDIAARQLIGGGSSAP